MKSIAMFNNKGGVGKTTLLCNLSSFLAKERLKNVLIIDADPQCNATQSLFSDSEVEDIYGRSSFTIQNIIRPLSKGKGFSKEAHVRHSTRFGVDVLLGDPGMSLNEDLLATDWVAATSGSVRGLRTTFLFAELLSRFKHYDYVFFDVGPSLGSINRAVLLAVDTFVAPMAIDIFSIRALDNIGKQLTDWKKKLDRGLEDAEDLDDIGVGDPRWKLGFAGYVTQQYKAKTTAGVKQPVQAYERIMKQVPRAVQEKLIERLGLQGDGGSKLLGSIPLLHSLIPMSQSARAPIFDLGYTDGVRGAHLTRIKEYKAVISGIADRFEEEISRAD